MLKGKMERWRVSLFGYMLHVVVDDVKTGEPQVRQLLEQAGVRVEAIREESYSLEDVFIAVVEKSRAVGKFVEES